MILTFIERLLFGQHGRLPVVLYLDPHTVDGLKAIVYEWNATHYEIDHITMDELVNDYCAAGVRFSYRKDKPERPLRRIVTETTEKLGPAAHRGVTKTQYRKSGSYEED